jgi:hypothetical protein
MILFAVVVTIGSMYAESATGRAMWWAHLVGSQLLGLLFFIIVVGPFVTRRSLQTFSFSFCSRVNT